MSNENVNQIETKSTADLRTGNVREQLERHLAELHPNLDAEHYRIEHKPGATRARVVIEFDIRAPNAEELAEQCSPSELIFEELDQGVLTTLGMGLAHVGRAMVVCEETPELHAYAEALRGIRDDIQRRGSVAGAAQ